MENQTTFHVITLAFSHAEPITIFVIGLISFIFISVLLILIHGYRRFNNDYSNIMRSLDKYERNSATREVVYFEIKNIFKIAPSFLHPWQEFSETIIKERKEDGDFEYRNTHEAHDFFDVDAVISASRAWLFNFRLGTFGSIPNILTGLGIVGTFFGIMTGVPEANTAEAISSGIPKFLVGMKGAFLASLAGLISALVFTAIEKFLIDLMETKCRLLAEKLDSIFRLRTSQDFLSELSYSANQQLAALKSLPLDFGKQIISGLTGAGVETMQISESVKAGVSLGFEQLASSLREFNKFQTEFANNVLTIQQEQNAIAANFNQLNQSTIECANVIKSASGALMESATEVKTMVSKLSETVTLSRDNLEGQKASAEVIKTSIQTAEKTILEFHKNQTTVVTSLGETVMAFKQVNESFNKQVADYHQNINTSLRSNLETFEEHLGNGVKKLGGGVSGLGDMISNLNTTLTDANKVYKTLSLVKSDEKPEKPE